MKTPTVRKRPSRKKPPKVIEQNDTRILREKLKWINAQLLDHRPHPGMEEWRPWAEKRVKQLRADISGTGIDISTLI